MTTFMTASPTFVLMSLLILLFYAIFASYKRVRVVTLLSVESTFVIIFMLWFLTFGTHLAYHGVFANPGAGCAVEDDLLTTTVYSNITLMGIVAAQIIILFSIEIAKKAADAINLRRPEAVYNNLCIEVNNNTVTADDSDISIRRLLYVQSLLFLVFWAPFYVIRLMYIVDGKKHTLAMIVFQLYAYLIGYFKSTVAPIATLIVYPESRFLVQKIRELDLESLKLKNVWTKK